MSQKSYNEIRNINEDWALDARNGLPYSGQSVQNFIKKTLNSKGGDFYYDADSNKYIIFADEGSRALYLSDRETYADLVIGTFDAPANFTAEIMLSTPVQSTVLSGTTGNYIDFTFDIKNKSGSSTGDDIIATFTFNNGGNVKKVTQVYNAGTNVHFLADQYLSDGSNSINITITGRNTLASTVAAITYNVILLELTSTFDFSIPVEVGEFLAFPYRLEGSGVKYLEWFVDGERYGGVDAITDLRVNRVKNIDTTGMEVGKHDVQVRAYISNNGVNFHSKTLYYNFVVSPEGSVWQDNVLYVMLGLVLDEPTANSISVNAKQYQKFEYKASVYDSRSRAGNLIVSDNREQVQSITIPFETYEELSYTPTTTGEHILTFSTDGDSVNVDMNVSSSGVNIDEVTDSVLLKLSARGRSNSETNPAVWSYGNIETTFNNFEWNAQSGWHDGALVIPAGSSIEIGFQPFGGSNPATNGRTIEIDYETTNIEDDDASVINLVNNSTNAAFQVTATSASLRSSGGANVNTKYNDGDRVHLAFIINKTTGDNARLMFIVNNGKAERCANFAARDSFRVDGNLVIGSDNCTIKVHSIRVYGRALTVDEAFCNSAVDSDNLLQIASDNDIYNESTGLIDADKVNVKVPVMIITGNMQPIFDTTDKNTTVYVDIEYRDRQDATKNFTATHVRMRPQGTSSLGYPRKNLRPYTSSQYGCTMYDANGNVLEDGLYAFKDGAQPVNCWTLKADFAESSGSHNTGAARFWNNLFYNTQIDGQFLLRTEAQKVAAQNNFGYDVRTAIDGFPIVVFNRLTEDSELVCLGQYNFNNDKSTESVFGFTGIPNFDNTNVQCFEFLANESPLCLFTDVSTFDANWDDAFESRYPDTKTPNLAPLKELATWINSCKNNQEKWNSEKAAHFDIPKLAGIYVYLMRSGAVDQPVKNSMIMTEDGVHWFFILYDNDTILGIDNISTVLNVWNYDRSTQKTGGAYYFAGHDSVLWNCFENDPECMEWVSKVDDAMYGAGLTYANMIKMFDEEQCDKWCERIYNENSDYKYVQPYKESGAAVLYMLQGSRKSYRHWWLQHRMDLYDAKWATGAFKSRVVRFIAEGAQGGTFSVTSASDTYFGYGINSVTQERGVYIGKNASHDFTIERTLAIGDPVSIYNANNAKVIDLSDFAEHLTTLYINQAIGNNGKSALESLILGDGVSENVVFTEIGGLSTIKSLQEIDIRGFKAVTSMELAALANLHVFKAADSGLTSFSPANGVTLNTVSLPATIQSLVLNSATVGTLTYTPTVALNTVSLINVSGEWDAKTFVMTWLNMLNASQLDNADLTLIGINWSGMTSADVVKLLTVGTHNLRGTVAINSITVEDYNTIVELAGASVFNENSTFFVSSPTLSDFQISSSTLKAGGTASLSYIQIPVYDDAVIGYEMFQNGTKVVPVEGVATYGGVSLNTATGQITSTYAATAGTLSFRATYTRNGITTYSAMKEMTVVAMTYPTSVSISGADTLIALGTTGYDYTKSFDTQNFNADIISVTWALSSDSYTSIDSQSASGATLNYESVPSVATNVILSCIVLFEGGVERTGTKTVSQAVVPITSFKIFGSPINEVGSHQFTIAGITPSVYNVGIVAASASISPSVQDVSVTCTTSAATVTVSQMPSETTTTTLTIVATLANGSSITQTKDVVVGDIYEMECTYVLYEGHSYQYGMKLYNSALPNLVDVIFDGESIGVTSYVYVQDREEHSVVFCFSQRLTELKESAFYGCNDLISISIPNTVLSIKSDALHGTNLISLHIPASVTSIRDGSITSSKLVSITVDPNNTHFDSRNNCNALIEKNYGIIRGCKNSAIPTDADVRRICAYAFSGCDFDSIVIPSNITILGNYAFAYSRIKSLYIYSTSIDAGGLVFSNCAFLETIYTNAKLNGAQMFDRSDNISSIVIGEDYVDNDVLIDTPKSKLVSITVDPNNTHYDSRNNCNAVMRTSDNALLLGCNTTVIPAETTSIGIEAFYNCTNITLSSLPSGVTSIGAAAFSMCTNITLSSLPSGVTSIGGRAFHNCTNITLSSLPSGLTSIGNGAFYNCTNITLSSLPSGVTSIGNGAFYNCTNITLSSLPSGVTSIGYEAFYNCTNITLSSLPSGLTSIDYEAFYNCTNITLSSLPSGLTSIGARAFDGCTNITSITIPSGVTSLASRVFSRTSITSLFIHAGISYIDDFNGTPCDDCPFLETIIVEEGNSKYDSRNNCNAVIVKATNKLLFGCSRTVIPADTTIIGERAFYYCTSLTSITIPSSVTTIETYAFYHCELLSEINSLSSVAPTCQRGGFEGVGASATGAKNLNVPSGATGYDTGAWKSELLDRGFTLNETL